MYRIVYLSNKWYAVKMDGINAYSFTDYDLEALDVHTSNGEPVLLVQDLEDVPSYIEFEIVSK